MTRPRALWTLAALLLVALSAVTWAQPPARELAAFGAPTTTASAAGERLARSVRYTELRLRTRATVRVRVDGAHGGVLLSLVDGDDRVREVRLEPDESVGRFAAVDPGRFALRVLAAPPAPPKVGESIQLHVTAGGRPWPLFALAALLLVAPPLLVSARKRSAAEDGAATNR